MAVHSSAEGSSADTGDRFHGARGTAGVLMLYAALLRHEGCPQRGLGPLGRRFITGMSGRFLSTVNLPDSNDNRSHLHYDGGEAGAPGLVSVA
jgi:hypothetical protein